MNKTISCPTCKRTYELPEGFKPTILKESEEEKKYFVCPCCRTRVEIKDE